MKRTVDASVAVKWFVSEAGETEAVALLRQQATLYAPDLIFSEITNTFWRKLLKKEATPALFDQACARLGGYLASVVPSVQLMQRACEIAVAIKHPAYDCFYVACAERHDAPLVTDDRRLLSVIADHPGLARHVTPLHA